MANPNSETEHAADEAVDHAVNRARSMKDDAEATIERYRNQAGRLQDDLLSEIRDRPLRTLAIASAIGFAVGVIWKA